jgi:hypothetical protein
VHEVLNLYIGIASACEFVSIVLLCVLLPFYCGVI